MVDTGWKKFTRLIWLDVILRRKLSSSRFRASGGTVILKAHEISVRDDFRLNLLSLQQLKYLIALNVFHNPGLFYLLKMF